MDANQFKELFLPYHAKLYRVAFRLMGNTQDAEDMVQEAYLKLWKKRNELPNNIESMEAYCSTLVKNICYDALRISQLDEDGRSPEEISIPGSHNIAAEIEIKEEANQVMKLISQLPEQQQLIIQMRDVDDRSYEEIEEATGLSPINIRVLLSRARKKIREQFKEIMNYERV
jgi:RNA polymerase sigma-70 factor (ECF subfamily)